MGVPDDPAHRAWLELLVYDPNDERSSVKT